MKFRERKKVCGIYYLVDYREEGVVVLYVGATKDLARRLNQHVGLKNIPFCDVYVDRCEEGELWEKEARAIKEFRPIMNKSLAGVGMRSGVEEEEGKSLQRAE